jgi:lipocalin
MFFSTCKTIEYGAKDAQLVKHFDVQQYVGTWYEIYRLPMRAERDLVNVTATYELRSDGRIDVLNQGYKHTPTGKHKSAKAIAWQPDKDYPAALFVRFFHLFKSTYHVLYVDDSYQYAIVSTYKRDYAWVLARKPQIPDKIEQDLKNKAKEYNIDVSQFIKTVQKW